MGKTKILCTASIVEDVPHFLKGRNSGWVTAEYAMLPGSTRTRTIRERNRGSAGGRTLEIQRLIGRSLRAVVDLGILGQRTIWIDCDVLQSDGGTRTAAVNGASVALCDAFRRMKVEGMIEFDPMNELIAAVSVGIISNFPLLDLSYEEDSRADVDLNLVMTETGRFVEIQGAAEGETFSRGDLDTFIDLGEAGIQEIIRAQRESLDAG
jgi:ribonuclease PH